MFSAYLLHPIECFSSYTNLVGCHLFDPFVLYISQSFADLCSCSVRTLDATTPDSKWHLFLKLPVYVHGHFNSDPLWSAFNERYKSNMYMKSFPFMIQWLFWADCFGLNRSWFELLSTCFHEHQGKCCHVSLFVSRAEFVAKFVWAAPRPPIPPITVISLKIVERRFPQTQILRGTEHDRHVSGLILFLQLQSRHLLLLCQHQRSPPPCCHSSGNSPSFSLLDWLVVHFWMHLSFLCWDELEVRFESLSRVWGTIWAIMPNCRSICWINMASPQWWLMYPVQTGFAMLLAWSILTTGVELFALVPYSIGTLSVNFVLIGIL